MDNFYIQLLTLLILLLCNVLAGLIPLIIVRTFSKFSANDQIYFQRNRVLSFFLNVGGGVFMSVCLLILLPESREQFELNDEKKHHNTTEESSHKGHEEEFPIPEFVVLCGFFATFAVEEALHYILYHCRRRNTTCDRKVRFCSCAKRHTECSRTFKAENPEQTMFGQGKNDYNNVGDYSGTIEQIQNANLLRTSLIPQHVPNYGSVANMTDPRTNEAPPIITAPVMIANNGNVAIVQGLVEVLSSPVTISTSNLLFVLALSFYATCQGTTIGLLTQSSPWITLLVACLQQTVLVFIVGWIGVAQSELISPVVAYVLVLSFMSPFGISLAMFLEEKMSGISPLVSGFSKAVVCGSILYLTFCDLLRRRKLKESPHIERFAGFTLGAAAMAALEYVSMII